MSINNYNKINAGCTDYSGMYCSAGCGADFGRSNGWKNNIFLVHSRGSFAQRAPSSPPVSLSPYPWYPRVKLQIVYFERTKCSDPKKGSNPCLYELKSPPQVSKDTQKGSFRLKLLFSVPFRRENGVFPSSGPIRPVLPLQSSALVQSRTKHCSYRMLVQVCLPVLLSACYGSCSIGHIRFLLSWKCPVPMLP